mgnify:CR=1 FL=1
MNPKNKDFVLSAFCGFLAGFFLLLIIKNPYVPEFQGLAKLGGVLWFLPLLFAFLFFLAIVVAKTLFKPILFIIQLAKFAETGVLNTLIDIGVLNVLIWITDITSGMWIIAINMVSFSLATINSYFWNKFWTFEKKEETKGKEFVSFFVVSLVGIGINTGIVFLGSTFISPLFGVSSGAWINMMKILATFVSMVWNFVGYKFIVFKK